MSPILAQNSILMNKLTSIADRVFLLSIHRPTAVFYSPVTYLQVTYLQTESIMPAVAAAVVMKLIL